MFLRQRGFTPVSKLSAPEHCPSALRLSVQLAPQAESQLAEDPGHSFAVNARSASFLIGVSASDGASPVLSNSMIRRQCTSGISR